MYTIHAGALETITIDGVYGSFTTNAGGTVNHALPLGELTLHGSVSGNSFTRTVTKDTTDVYVMPDGALYWYGNENTATGGFEARFYDSDQTSFVSKKLNYIKISGQAHQASIVISSNNKMSVSGYSLLKIIASANFISKPFCGTTRFANALFHTQCDKSTTDILGIAEVWKGYDNVELNKQILTVDVSAVSKSVYIGAWTYNLTSEIYAVWLE